MFCAGEVVFVVTPPKPKVPGAMPRTKVAATLVPLRVNEVGEVGALLTMEMLPGLGPGDADRRFTVIVVWFPGFTFIGSENPLTE